MMAAAIASLSGCGKKKGKQIFVDEEAQYQLKRVSEKNISNNVFYVKDGTSFYAVYKPNQIKKGDTYYVDRDFELLPNLYSNEIIAYKTTETTLENIPLVRYYDLGYSLSLFDASFDSEGFLCFAVGENTIGKSSISTGLKKAPSSNIRIERINGIRAKEYSLSEIGSIEGLTKGATYEFTCYAGSSYGTYSAEADNRFLTSYESYTIAKASTTKNGYLAITMPEDAKSGIYQIADAGMFIYHAHKKGECADAGDDINEPYYKTTAEELAKRYQQYICEVDKNTLDVKFTILYNINDFEEKDIRLVMQSPEGEIYDINKKDGTGTLELAEVEAGNWVVNIYPKGASITNISYESTAPQATAICDTFTITTDYKIPYAQFHVPCTGVTKDADNTAKIWGVVESEDGEAHELHLSQKNDNDMFLYCNWRFLGKGTYTLKVYHYNTSSVKEPYIDELSTFEEEIVFTSDNLSDEEKETERDDENAD